MLYISSEYLRTLCNRFFTQVAVQHLATKTISQGFRLSTLVTDIGIFAHYRIQKWQMFFYYSILTFLEHFTFVLKCHNKKIDTIFHIAMINSNKWKNQFL